MFPADEVMGGALGPLFKPWWEKVQHRGLLAKVGETSVGALCAAWLEYLGLKRLSGFFGSGPFSTGLRRFLTTLTQGVWW